MMVAIADRVYMVGKNCTRLNNLHLFSAPCINLNICHIMPPIVEWPQIMEGNIAHILIIGNILLNVKLVIYSIVLLYCFIGTFSDL